MPESLLRIDIVCVVPQILESVISSSILKRAQDKGLVEIHLHNLHDYATDTYRHIDDTPYGGGAGMIIQCEPVFACIEELLRSRSYDEVIYLSPDGEVLDQKMCNSLSLKHNLILLCGHYKGIDQRIRDLLVTREVSIGDYVLTGGEIAAGVLTDAIVRLVPGVVGDADTKPADFRGHSVPEVLLSGNHAHIRNWRQQQALQKTRQRRPDLLEPGDVA
jgi:tRNA (guanine37-N1)-methyltransferase